MKTYILVQNEGKMALLYYTQDDSTYQITWQEENNLIIIIFGKSFDNVLSIILEKYDKENILLYLSCWKTNVTNNFVWIL